MLIVHVLIKKNNINIDHRAHGDWFPMKTLVIDLIFYICGNNEILIKRISNIYYGPNKICFKRKLF